MMPAARTGPAGPGGRNPARRFSVNQRAAQNGPMTDLLVV